MPQARSSGPRSGAKSGASKAKSPTRSKAAAKRPTGSAAKKTTTRSTAAKTTSRARSTSAKTPSAVAEAQYEAAAQRLRKLNERIITAGKDAGESTLTSYEKALKAIATAVEKGPGTSDIDWIAHLANTQAKFIRDLTNSWASAARDLLK
jgi:hypothetical protein